MNKQQLKEWVELEYHIGANINTKTLLSKIDQLDEPAPALLPFQWPVPENMQVVTRDGREVTQLVKFDCNELYPIKGILNGGIHGWYKDGKFDAFEDKKDLFLRPKSPEMIEAWYCEKENHQEITLNEKTAQEHRNFGYTVRSISFPKPTKSDI